MQSRQKATNAPFWFSDAVVTGMQKLLPLSLAGQPPADAIDIAAKSWVNALWHHKTIWWDKEDIERIKSTFDALCCQCERWPTPALFVKNLQKRQEAEAAPLMSVEQKQAIGSKNLKAIRQQLNLSYRRA